TAIYVGTAEELARPLGALTPSAVTRGCKDGKGRIGSIVLVPSGSDDEHVSIRVVASHNSANCAADLHSGCIEARRSLGFVPHTPLYLPVQLAKSCENVVCDNASDTCVSGQCVPSAIECNGACPTPGIDGGPIDATFKDVLGVKDVISVSDVLTLDDSPIVPLDSSSLDATSKCLPVAVLDAGVPTYFWHFNEGSGTTTFEATFGTLALPAGASFVPGPSNCLSALALMTNPFVAGTSAALGSPSPRVGFWMKTTGANGAILSTFDIAGQKTLWALFVQAGNLAANVCGANGCVALNTLTAVADGAWHSIAFAHNQFGSSTVLLVDGIVAGTNTILLNTSTNASLTVGINGAIDELRFGGN
ncbi:MAG TPA: LamG-like jellyroll fold domain-containing protein, partial [Polyangiaceae bacterium]